MSIFVDIFLEKLTEVMDECDSYNDDPATFISIRIHPDFLAILYQELDDCIDGYFVFDIGYEVMPYGFSSNFSVCYSPF